MVYITLVIRTSQSPERLAIVRFPLTTPENRSILRAHWYGLRVALAPANALGQLRAPGEQLHLCRRSADRTYDRGQRSGADLPSPIAQELPASRTGARLRLEGGRDSASRARHSANPTGSHAHSGATTMPRPPESRKSRRSPGIRGKTWRSRAIFWVPSRQNWVHGPEIWGYGLR